MFKHLYTYRLRVLLKNKSLLFWTCAFPLLLGLLFTMSFKNLDKVAYFETVNVGLVGDDPAVLDTLKNALQDIKTTSGPPLVSPKIFLKDEANKALEKGDVSGIYEVGESGITLKITYDDLPQMVLSSLLSQYEQENKWRDMFSAEELADMRNQSDMPDSTFKDEDEEPPLSQLSFYMFTLIGMTIMYGYMWGLTNAHDQQANQSEKGVRLSLIPVNKLVVTGANLLAGFTVFYTSLLLILSVLHFGYGVEFGNRWLAILVVCALGSVTALSFGTFIGDVLVKKTLNQKIGMGVSVTMFLSFAAGMMGTQDLKIWIDQHLPVLGRLNFVNLISESLFQLYSSKELTYFYQNMFWLIGFATLSFVATYVVERKVQYDNL